LSFLKMRERVEGVVVSCIVEYVAGIGGGWVGRMSGSYHELWLVGGPGSWLEQVASWKRYLRLLLLKVEETAPSYTRGCHSPPHAWTPYTQCPAVISHTRDPVRATIM